MDLTRFKADGNYNKDDINRLLNYVEHMIGELAMCKKNKQRIRELKTGNGALKEDNLRMRSLLLKHEPAEGHVIMTPKDLELKMEELQAEESIIRRDRGRRYGTKEDCLANVAEFGPDGATINMWECFSRISNKANRVRKMFGLPKDLPDLKNAVQDLRNYAAYILILAEREV